MVHEMVVFGPTMSQIEFFLKNKKHLPVPSPNRQIRRQEQAGASWTGMATLLKRCAFQKYCFFHRPVGKNIANLIFEVKVKDEKNGRDEMKRFLIVVLLGLIWTVQAEEDRKTILFLGDSLTAGYGLDKTQAFPALIQAKVDSLRWAFDVVNGGLSGETSAGGLRRVNWLLRREIDVLVLALGGNDGLRGIPVAEMQQNLQGIIDYAKEQYPDMQIVLVGIEAPPNLGDEYTTAFRAVFQTLSEKNRVLLIPFLLEGVGGIPELNLPDRIHPNAAGHRIIAETVWRVLKPILESGEK